MGTEQFNFKSVWETPMTDPAQHDSTNFRYVVHAIQPEFGIGQTMQAIFLIQEQMKNPNIKYNRINLLRAPRRIADKPLISASLIDDTHTGTWQSFGGFILKVPADNILKTSSSDCGTLFYGGADVVAQLYKERDTQGVASPEDLLQLTSSYSYNEVVLAGTGRTGKKVEVIGVFAKVLPNGAFVAEDLTSILGKLAGQNGWPFVRIQEAFYPYEDCAPAVSEDGRWLGFNADGKRYILAREGAHFSVTEFGGKVHRPMTPSERAYALGVVREHLLTSPDGKLEKFLREAEAIPDSALLERIIVMQKWTAAERQYEEHV